jgi:hypothetical protein
MTDIEITDMRGEPQTALKLLHDTQVSIEKARVAVGNRKSAIERGADDSVDPTESVYGSLEKALLEWEKILEDLMGDEAEKYPVFEHWLRHVKGIGPALSGQLLAMLLPPLPDRGPSTWYKAGGLTVEEHDGQSRLPRARKGQEGLSASDATKYYPRLRRCLHNVATSFVRTGGYYREVYDTKKARLTAQHAGDTNWPPHRLDAVARWIMVKLFLAHLWEMWLEAEGTDQDARRAYVIDVLKHPHFIPAPRWNGGGKI